MNIYVGNLPFSASEDEVRQAFEAFGQVASVSLITDKFTGQSRGFAFIEMPNLKEAQAAIDGLNGSDFGDRALVVNQARPREERSGGGRGGYSGGGRGGYSGGGGGRGGGRGGSRGGREGNRGSGRNDW